jgi:hypothetical protein
MNARSRRDWTFAHHGICVPSLLHRHARRVFEAQEIAIAGARSHPFDEIGDAQQCFRGQLVCHHALEARPERNGSRGRNQTSDRPAADPRRNYVRRSRDRDCDHEGEEHPQVRGSDVAAIDPAEGDRETDQNHDYRRQPR